MDSKYKDQVTVVIPVKDEAATLSEIISKCAPFCSSIIVVDGHSKDDSVAIAERSGARVIFDNRRGKGDAIRSVIPELKTDIVVFIDADGSHDPNDIGKLLEPLLRNECDHVSASRLIGGSSELHGGFDEFLRLAGSSFVTACINRRFRVRLSESQNGFRAIKTEVLKQLKLQEDLTTIEQEMIIKTLRKGFKMGEVPSHEHRRKVGESHIQLHKVWYRYLWTMFRYLFLPIK